MSFFFFFIEKSYVQPSVIFSSFIVVQCCVQIVLICVIRYITAIYTETANGGAAWRTLKRILHKWFLHWKKAYFSDIFKESRISVVLQDNINPGILESDDDWYRRIIIMSPSFFALVYFFFIKCFENVYASTPVTVIITIISVDEYYYIIISSTNK